MLALAIILGFVHMLAATQAITNERGLWVEHRPAGQCASAQEHDC
jgi:hypothetical protein